jgi:hypothetical protein
VKSVDVVLLREEAVKPLLGGPETSVVFQGRSPPNISRGGTSLTPGPRIVRNHPFAIKKKWEEK